MMSSDSPIPTEILEDSPNDILTHATAKVDDGKGTTLDLPVFGGNDEADKDIGLGIIIPKRSLLVSVPEPNNEVVDADVATKPFDTT